MAFTDPERTDIRRFCGYPAAGATDPWPHGHDMLEFRMNNLSDSESVVVRRYLTTLNALELAVPRAGENLDTDQAAVWTRNRDELRDRTRLFDDWRRRLCGFMGVPPGPALAESGLSLIV